MERQIQNELVAKKIIRDQIIESRVEIVINSSWFVDDNLFQLLLKRAKEGISIKLILDNNYWHKKIKNIVLPEVFQTVKKEEVTQQNYCYVFDSNIIIYALKKQAKYGVYNPFDNIVFTDNKEILKKHIKVFEKMDSLGNKEETLKSKKGLFDWLKRIFNQVNKENNVTTILEKKEYEISNLNLGLTAVDEVLDSIITTNVENFDKQEVLLIGSDSAEKVKGSPSQLPRVMDALYSVFVTNTNNHLKQKEDLKTKIDLKAVELINAFSLSLNRKISIKEEESIVKRKEGEIEINYLDKDKQETELTISKLIVNISNKEIEITEAEKRKHELNIESIPEEKINKVVKKFAILFHTVLSIGLFGLIFMFYASATYILFYAEQDYLNNDILPSYINLNFISDALSKQGVTIWYILFFSCIPIAVAWFSDYTKNYFYTKLGYFAIIALDILVAFNVKNAIGNVKRLEGLTNTTLYNFEWFSEFIVIFFFGFVPLAVFISIIKRLANIIKEGTYSKTVEQLKIKEQQLNNELISLIGELSDFEQQKDYLEEKTVKIEGLKKEIYITISYLPLEEKQHIDKIKEEIEAYNLYVIKRADIYKNGIDNNTIYFPVVSLKERISSFLDGWNAWLYQEYSVEKASSLAEQADSIINMWLDENISLPGENIIKTLNLIDNEKQ